MARDLFDPDRAKGADPPPRDYANLAEADVLTVSQLSGVIKQTLEQRIASPLRVIGEVSNLSARQHWYFSLKDESSVIGCVAWASTVRRLKFRPEDGHEVVATGHVSYYGPQGRTQLYVSDLKPVGAGELELRFRALCDELRGLGYFDDQRKRPLPAFPRALAVITSAESAALQDVVATAERRCPAVKLRVVDVRVQGENAAAGIARAIEWVNRRRERLGVDAIIVTRGGGSMEDLWAFNERVVADAALASELPLVAAVGHESDTTVIELVADVRAATPTQAVMLSVPDAGELRRQLDHHAQRLNLLTRRRVTEGRHRVDAAARHELFRRPRDLFSRAAEHAERLRRHLEQAIRHRLAGSRVTVETAAARWAAIRPPQIIEMRRRRMAVLEDRLHRAAAASIVRRRVAIDGFEQRLAALDARQILRRGFTYTTAEDGSLVRSVGDVRPGRAILTHVADGAIRSVVKDAGDAPEGEQMDLFDAKP